MSEKNFSEEEGLEGGQFEKNCLRQLKESETERNDFLVSVGLFVCVVIAFIISVV